MRFNASQSRAGLWVGLAIGLISIVIAVGTFLLRDQDLEALQEEEQKKLTPDSEIDATQPVVDEGYRFRFELPGEGWKLASQQALVNINPDALAGVIRIAENRENWAVVLVDEVPDCDIVKWAERTPADLGLIEPEVGPVETIDFAGHTAARFTAKGMFNGRLTGLLGVIYARGDYVFSVLAYDMPHTGDMSFNRSAIAAFHPLPGDITPRPPNQTPDDGGVGWRVKDGTLESSAYGLRVKPTAKCRVDGGFDAHANADYTELLLLCRDPQLWVKVAPYHGAGADETRFTAWLRDTVVEGFTPLEPDATLKVAGRSVTMKRALDVTGDEMLAGSVRLDGDLYLSIIVGYVPTLRTRVDAELAGVLSGLSQLNDGEADAIAAALGHVVVPAQIGEGFAYRAGAWIDFDNGIAWKRPTSHSWRVRAGDAATMTAGAALWIREPAIDVTAYVYVDAEFSGAATQFFERERGALPPYYEWAVEWGDGVQVWLARGDGGEFLAVEQWVATTYVDGVGYTLFIDYPIGNKKRGRKATRALLEGFRINTGGPLQPIERLPGAYRDYRLGFEVPLPIGGDALKEVNELDSTQLVFTGSGGKEVVGIASVSMGDGDPETMHGIVVQTMVGKLSTKATGVPKKSPSSIAGQDAERIRYEMGRDTVFDLHHFVRENILYAVLLSGTPSVADSNAQRVRLLPALHF